MKECLQCKTEFESKRDAGKFCSPKCRVKWHRKNPTKENKLDKVQVQVLYNAMLELVSKINYQPVIEDLKMGLPIIQKLDDTPLVKKTTRTFNQYISLKKELQFEQEFKDFYKELEADNNLTEKQKQLIIISQ